MTNENSNVENFIDQWSILRVSNVRLFAKFHSNIQRLLSNPKLWAKKTQYVVRWNLVRIIQRIIELRQVTHRYRHQVIRTRFVLFSRQVRHKQTWAAIRLPSQSVSARVRSRIGIACKWYFNICNGLFVWWDTYWRVKKSMETRNRNCKFTAFRRHQCDRIR